MSRRPSRAAIIGMLALVGILVTACTSGSGSNATTSTTSPSTTTQITTEPYTTLTVPTAVKRLDVGVAVEAALVKVFSTYRSVKVHPSGYAAIPPGSIGGGSLRYAYVPATKTYWAMGSFDPKVGISQEASVGFQDGGNSAVFTKTSDGQWVVAYVGPCANNHVPSSVTSTWGIPASSPYPGC